MGLLRTCSGELWSAVAMRLSHETSFGMTILETASNIVVPDQ